MQICQAKIKEHEHAIGMVHCRHGKQQQPTKSTMNILLLQIKFCYIGT